MVDSCADADPSEKVGCGTQNSEQRTPFSDYSHQIEYIESDVGLQNTSSGEQLQSATVYSEPRLKYFKSCKGKTCVNYEGYTYRFARLGIYAYC